MAIEHQKTIQVTFSDCIDRMRECATYLSGKTLQSSLLEIREQFNIVGASIFAESAKIEVAQLSSALEKAETWFLREEQGEPQRCPLQEITKIVEAKIEKLYKKYKSHINIKR